MKFVYFLKVDSKSKNKYKSWYTKMSAEIYLFKITLDKVRWKIKQRY